MVKDEEITEAYKREFKEANLEDYKEKFGKYIEMTDDGDTNIEEMIESMAENPRRWFPIKIKELVEQGFVRMAIISANTYAESVMDFWFKDINSIRLQRNLMSESEAEELANYSYSFKLNTVRELGILDDSTYGTLKRLNKSRNSFAHNIDAHKPDNKTEIEEELSMEELVEFIENLFVEYQDGFIDWIKTTTT